MRLIDADALKALIIRRRKEAKTLTGIDMVMVIDDAPTVEAAPVVHGRWIKGGYACGENEYKCSACGETEWRTGCKRMKYCMYCGAKMDLEEQDAKEKN